MLQLEYVCDDNDIDLVCVSQHWLKQEQIVLFVRGHFIPAILVFRNIRENGGVGIYVKNHFKLSIIDVSEFYLELDCELCCAKLTDENIIILIVYRSPRGEINTFV